MKVRLLAASTCLLALGAAVAPAQATPYAGDFRYLDSGTLTIRGADGARWLLQVFATQGSQFQTRSEQRLYLDLSRCAASSCVVKGRWSRPLTAAEVSISQVGLVSLATDQRTKATLHTVLGGRDLDISLVGEQVTGGAFEGVGSSTSPVGVAPQAVQYEYAKGSARLGSMTCQIGHAEATIGETELVDTVGDDTRDPRGAPPATLPAGFLSGARTARC